MVGFAHWLRFLPFTFGLSALLRLYTYAVVPFAFLYTRICTPRTTAVLLRLLHSPHAFARLHCQPRILPVASLPHTAVRCRTPARAHSRCWFYRSAFVRSGSTTFTPAFTLPVAATLPHTHTHTFAFCTVIRLLTAHTHTRCTFTFTRAFYATHLPAFVVVRCVCCVVLPVPVLVTHHTFTFVVHRTRTHLRLHTCAPHVWLRCTFAYTRCVVCVYFYVGLPFAYALRLPPLRGWLRYILGYGLRGSVRLVHRHAHTLPHHVHLVLPPFRFALRYAFTLRTTFYPVPYHAILRLPHRLVGYALWLVWIFAHTHGRLPRTRTPLTAPHDLPAPPHLL